MESNKVHFLKISGTLPMGKRKEFEQTFKFVLNHQNPDCMQFILTIDIFSPNLYHFFSLWRTGDSLKHFCQSQEFEVLTGAFRTLGTGEKEKGISGEMIDLSSFLVTDLNAPHQNKSPYNN